MKQIKIICILLISLFLLSCKNMYTPSEELQIVQAKNTYKSFENLEEQPIVITMPVYINYHLFGNPNGKTRRDRVGDMFVIIDTKTNEVYDWVFYDGETNFSFDRPVSACKEPVRYFSNIKSQGQVACLDPRKTEVTKMGITTSGYFYNWGDTPGNYCVIDSANVNREKHKTEFCLTTYNCETGVTGNKLHKVCTDSYGYIFHPIGDENNNFWYSYLLDGYAYIAKLDCEKEELKICDTKYFCYKEGKEKYDFSCSVMYADNNLVFLKKGKLGTGPFDESRLFVIDFSDNKEIEHEIQYEHSGYETIFRMAKCNDKYYIVMKNSEDETNAKNILEVNLDDYTTKKINNEPILIKAWDNIWSRGSKIYMMDSGDSRKIYFNYFDVETKEAGKGWNFTQIDLINGNY